MLLLECALGFFITAGLRFWWSQAVSGIVCWTIWHAAIVFETSARQLPATLQGHVSDLLLQHVVLLGAYAAAASMLQSVVYLPRLLRDFEKDKEFEGFHRRRKQYCVSFCNRHCEVLLPFYLLVDYVT